MTFDELWKSVSHWAEEQEISICSNGRALTGGQADIARKVGVRAPEKIRVLVVPGVPFPEDAAIRQIGASVGLTTEGSGGMTLRYGIFIRTDQTERAEIWPHEFRHVTQYE